MRSLQAVVAAPLTLVLALSTPVFAQTRHAVPPSSVAQAVVEHVAQQDTERAAIREALARPEAQRVASAMNLDMTKVSAMVDTLSPDALAKAAASAQQVNASLVGGASTVTISTTTIIIGLLIILLIIVAD